MAQQTINNGETGLSVRGKLNAMFGEIYAFTKATFGLGNVDNTSDANKPVSTATQAALDLKAPLASPALTGVPTAPNAAAATNNTQIANTAFVQAAVAALIASAPGALDTLDELAAAFGDDPNFAATMTTALAGKQPLDATLTALAGLAGGVDKLPYFTGADVLAQADLTTFGRSVIAAANSAALRAILNVADGATAYTDENARDAIGTALLGTANRLTVTVNDAGDTITLNIADEGVQDIIGAMVAAAGGVYDDVAGTITLPQGAAFVDVGTRPIAMWQAAGASTTITAQGEAALTATGTATASAAIAATNAYTARRLLEYLVTVAAATAVAGFRTAAAKWFLSNNATRGGFKAVCRFFPATGVATATNRCFVGFRPSAAPTDVEPSTLINMIGAGWAAADTNIQIMHNDGAGTATKIDLGANFPVPTADRTKAYELRLSADPNSTTVNYTFTDLDNPGQAASGSFNTDVPAANTMLAFGGYMSVGGTSSVIGIGLGTLTIQG